MACGSAREQTWLRSRVARIDRSSHRGRFRVPSGSVALRGPERARRAPSGAQRGPNRAVRAAGACPPPETEGWSEAGRARAPALPQTNRKFGGDDSRADEGPSRAFAPRSGCLFGAVALSQPSASSQPRAGHCRLNPELAATRPHPLGTPPMVLPTAAPTCKQLHLDMYAHLAAPHEAAGRHAGPRKQTPCGGSD